MNWSLTSKVPTNYLIAFLIGFVSAYPSIMPTILSILNDPSCDMYQKASLENMSLQLPPFYGILHIALFFIINNYLPNNLRTYWTLGFIIALIYPTLGTVGGHAKKVYGIESTLNLYIAAQLMYLPIYGLLFNFIFSNLESR